VVVRFYCDEDFADDGRVHAVRGSGLDLLTPKEAEMLSKSDPEQVRFSASQERMIITHNRTDFVQIHTVMMNAGEHHTGICVVRMEDWYGPGEVARRLQVLADVFSETGTRDQLLFLSNFG
jgi:hypothetical protein